MNKLWNWLIGLIFAILVAAQWGCNDMNTYPTVSVTKDIGNTMLDKAGSDSRSQFQNVNFKLDTAFKEYDEEFQRSNAERDAKLADAAIAYQGQIDAIHTRLEPFFEPIRQLLIGLPGGASLVSILDTALASAQQENADALEIATTAINSSFDLFRANQDKTDSLQDIAILALDEAADAAAALSDTEYAKLEEYTKANASELASLLASGGSADEIKAAVLADLAVKGFTPETLETLKGMSTESLLALMSALGLGGAAILRTFGKSRSQGQSDMTDEKVKDTRRIIKAIIDGKVPISAAVDDPPE